MGKKITTEYFKERLLKTHPNLEVLSDYISTNEPITVRCKIHNYVYVTTPHRLVQGSNCQKCYDDRRGKSLITEKYKVLERIEEKHGRKYVFPFFDTEYQNSKSKITAICPKHGEFKISVNKLLVEQGCRKCANEINGINKRITLDKFFDKVREIHGEKYSYPYIEKELVTTESLLSIICPKHGEFKQVCINHLQGYGCPYCNESRLEHTICKLLKTNELVFERQKKFGWLINNKTRYPMSLDFYLPEYNIAIECQGLQHFKPSEYFGGEKTFVENVERDILKNKLCFENRIRLIYVTNIKFEKLLKGIYNTDNTFFIEDKDIYNKIIGKLKKQYYET